MIYVYELNNIPIFLNTKLREQELEINSMKHVCDMDLDYFEAIISGIKLARSIQQDAKDVLAKNIKIMEEKLK